jgi:hypothetical protein
MFNFKLGNKVFFLTPDENGVLTTNVVEITKDSVVFPDGVVSKAGKDEMEFYFLKLLPAYGKIEDLDRLWEKREDIETRLNTMFSLNDANVEFRALQMKQETEMVKNEIAAAKLGRLNLVTPPSSGGGFMGGGWNQTNDPTKVS